MAWIEEILKAGGRRVDELEVYYAEGRTITAELQRDRVARATESRTYGLSIRTISDGRIGVSSSNDPSRWRECLDAAVSSGRLSTQQPWNGLPDKASISGELLSFDPDLQVDPGTAKDLLTRMMEGAKDHPATVTSGSASLSCMQATLANSHGIRYSAPSTGVSISLETISGQSTGYEFANSFRLDVDPEGVGRQAAFLASHSVDGKAITSGTYDVILSPVAVAQLLRNVVVPALSGRNVHAGRSRLTQSLGTQVFDSDISLYDDPHSPLGPGSTWWDAEGTLTDRVDFVNQGSLMQFAYDLKTAYRYGKSSTGSAVRSGYGGSPAIGTHNLVLDGKRSRIDDERALYIHDVVGAHTANAMSGDFSVELSNPCWIEGGVMGEPVRKAMLAGNVFDMLADTGGIGTDDRLVGSMILPSVRLSGQIIGD